MAPSNGSTGMNEQISQPILDQNTYEGLRDLLGPDRTGHLLDRLLVRVEACLKQTELTGEDLRRLAPEFHDLAGDTGMFGFLELSKACQVLESACHDTDDLASALEQFQTAARRVLHHKVAFH